jgi:DNA helicase-2/ATP-dependent DNA helicase PcrA
MLEVLPDKLGDREQTRQADLARLVRLAASFDGTCGEFAASLQERFGASAGRGVHLLTLHRAKGLEFDAVFVPRLEEGELPIRRGDVDEERRLLYVGITRAREHLALSWALARSPGQRRGRRPSRFLDGLRPAGPMPARARSRSAVPAAEDAELFGRLRAWRKAQAEAQGVPPYVVFSDATLVAIADARPQTRDGLARISGVGPTKLGRYADPVLEVVGGADPVDVAAVSVD